MPEQRGDEANFERLRGTGMTSRDKFEAWWEENYHNGNPPRFGWGAWRDSDGYQIDDDEPELDGMWQAWQAAELASEQKLTDLAVQLANAESRVAAVVAENAGLRQPERWLQHSERGDVAAAIAEGNGATESESLLAGIRAIIDAISTPATDAFLADVRAQARKDGAHFVANRMLAAWDAGFIDDTAKNAADIARMILTSTEFMPDAPEGDFDRSFADSILAEIAAQLRSVVTVEGGQKNG